MELFMKKEQIFCIFNISFLKPRLHEQILCGNFCVTNIMDRVDRATNNC